MNTSYQVECTGVNVNGRGTDAYFMNKEVGKRGNNQLIKVHVPFEKESDYRFGELYLVEIQPVDASMTEAYSEAECYDDAADQV